MGAYDSWHTMQSPDIADCYNTDFGKEFYQKGCVYTKEENPVKEFANRGCVVSMTALKQINNSIPYERFQKFKAEGINSYFLDCHGMLETHDDYSPNHAQIIFDDIEIRLEHLSYLSKQQVVLGSETAAASTIQFLAFSHGSFSSLYGLHYHTMYNKKLYGGWGSIRRPKIFFQSIKANNEYKIRYNPFYRIPMWQAVFHESCIATDRWEIPLTKFTNLFKDRFLLEFLYGVPSMWSLDIKAIQEYSHILRQLAEEFIPLHSEIM